MNSCGRANASAAKNPMSSTAIICSEVVGFRAFASTPSRGPIMGEVRFSMKNTGRRTVVGRPNDRMYSSICHLLSKCDSPVLRSAPPTDV